MQPTPESIKFSTLPNIMKYAPLIKDEATWTYYKIYVEEPFKQHSYEEIKPLIKSVMDNMKEKAKNTGD